MSAESARVAGTYTDHRPSDPEPDVLERRMLGEDADEVGGDLFGCRYRWLRIGDSVPAEGSGGKAERLRVHG
jgi:hypothetical protein